MRIIDLESLSIFRAVVSEGGVNRAAQKLHRVQSNVTTRIHQLEERLGAKLFRRDGRNIALTAQGENLLGYADRLLRLADETVEAISAGRAGGTFRLGSLESTAGSRLPPLLSAFHARHPAVTVDLATGTTAALVRRVTAFELDAAFVSEPFTAPGLEARPVFEEELLLITARGSAAVTRPAQLRGATLIAFSHGCSYRNRLEEWLARDGVMPARVMEFASYPAIIACVAAGSGFALVPRSVLAHLKTSKDVRAHALPAHIRRNRTHLIWRGAPSPALHSFLDLLPGAEPPQKAARKAA